MRREAAQKSADNSRKADEVSEKFRRAGQFRLPYGGVFRPFDSAFKRGFKQRWGPAKTLAEARPGVLVDEDGEEYPARQALPVEVAGPDVEVPEGLQKGKPVPEKYREAMLAWVKANQPVKMVDFQEELRRLGGKMKIRQQQLQALGLVQVASKGWYVEGDEPAPKRARPSRAKGARAAAAPSGSRGSADPAPG
jgi:hypothetical protein